MRRHWASSRTSHRSRTDEKQVHFPSSKKQQQRGSVIQRNALGEMITCNGKYAGMGAFTCDTYISLYMEREVHVYVDFLGKR